MRPDAATAADTVAPDEPATIAVRDLRMSYGPKDVLHGVDFEIRRGEVVVLLGPNGAGKTTTIEILEGFRTRTGGEVRVLGTDPAGGSEDWRSRIGIVLQSWRDHGKWRVGELLHHLGRYYQPYATSDRTRPWPVADLLDTVGLRAEVDQRISSLSGGQRRRLDLAIGIVGRPEALFLDEPTAGFDPQARREFHELIHRLSDLEDTTVLLTTHDLDEAERLADRILIMAAGRIVASGSAAQLGREVSSRAEVRWSRGAEHFVHATDDATGFVRELFLQYDHEIEDLEVRRPSLEDTYLAMVHRYESGSTEPGVTGFEEVTR